MDVEDDRVVNGQAEHDADKSELAVAFKRRRIEPKVLSFRVEGKHCKVRIENLVDDQLEKFFG